MTRGRNFFALPLLLPVLAAAAPSLQPQLPAGAVPSINVPIPPGNVLIRLNGTRTITERVFPTLANASGALNRDIASVTLVDRRTTVGDKPFTTGVAVKTWATDVKLRVTVGSDDWTASFRNAPDQRARIDSVFALNDASVDLMLHVRTQPITPIDQFVPEPIRQLANINATFTLGLDGFGSALDVVLRRDGNAVVIDSVERFQLNVGNVTVSDSVGLTNVANAVLGFDPLFNVVGASDANQAARLIISRLLQEDLGIAALLKTEANKAIRSFVAQQFANQQSLPIGSGALLLASPTFVRLASGNDWLIAEWTPSFDARPDDKVPGLQRRGGLAPAEPPNATPPVGALQAFVPYSQVDHLLYELLQAGLLRDFTVPPATQGGIGNGFRMHLVPTEAPGLRQDTSGTAQLALEFAARMDDASIGTQQVAPSVDGGPVRAPLTRVPIDVSTLNATAKTTMFVNLRVTNGAGIVLEIASVRLDDLSGQLRVATTTTDLAPHRPALQNVITTAIRNRTPQIGLAARSVGIAPPLRAVIGQPSFGPAYIRVPINLAVQ